MLVTLIDHENNLFKITNLVPQSLMEKILKTSWASLDYTLQEGHRNLRRRICDTQLPCLGQWHGMLHPVPHNTIGVTSYTWMHPL